MVQALAVVIPAPAAATPDDDAAPPPGVCCLLRLNPRMGAENPFQGYLEPAAAGLLLRPPDTVVSPAAAVGLPKALLLLLWSREGDIHSPPPPPGVDWDDAWPKPPSTPLPLRSRPPPIGLVLG